MDIYHNPQPNENQPETQFELAVPYRGHILTGGDEPNMGLIWAAICGNMGNNIMKTTIEIADDLFVRAQRVARKEKTTFRALTEQGLRTVLQVKETSQQKRKWKPITRGGGFVTDDIPKMSWERLRDEFIYPR